MFASLFQSASRVASVGAMRPATFRTTMRMCRQFNTKPVGISMGGRVSFATKCAGAGVGITAYLVSQKHLVHCEVVPVESNKKAVDVDELPPPPYSTVSVYELSFGTLAGICAGVFIKKGAKAAAFLLGGIFVLLQYFVSFSVVKVDWGAMAGKFERLIYTTDSQGQRKSPTIYSLFRWLVNFLTADFQPRASFVAGLVLGLRIG